MAVPGGEGYPDRDGGGRVLFFQPDQPQPSGQLDQGSCKIIAIQQKQPRPALTFFGGAAVLALGILVVKLIGMFYKIPLVNRKMV